MSETNKIIKNISMIKSNINQIFKDQIFIKNFSKKIIELLYQIDDYTEFISLEIILKTDLHKTLKILFQLSDAYLNVKKITQSILENIFINIKRELFNYDQDIFDYVNCTKDKVEFNKNLFVEQLDNLIRKRNNEDFNNIYIRTDEKFLEKIKKEEFYMNNEYRRREKIKKIENEKRFNLYLNNNYNENSTIILEDKIGKRRRRNINIEVIKKKNHINIIIDKSALNGIKNLQENLKDYKNNNVINTNFLGKKNKKNKEKLNENHKIIIEIPICDASDLFLEQLNEKMNKINQDNNIYFFKGIDNNNC